MEVEFHSFTASAQDGGEQSISTSGRFTHDDTPRYPLNRWLGGTQRKSGISGREKNTWPLQLTEPRFLASPTPTCTQLHPQNYMQTSQKSRYLTVQFLDFGAGTYVVTHTCLTFYRRKIT